MTGPFWSIDGVPRRPGVYLFRDQTGCVLYIGKARDLRARLASYRRPGGDGRLSIQFLERDARSVETIVTRTESEALLLEDTLIKQHKPPHNVRLKDDKSFLMLRLDRGERFPRFKFVRAHNPGQDKPEGRSRYFGPFASARAVRRTLADLHRVVPLRDCPDSVLNHRSRPCLKFQIGICSAPCVDEIDEVAYGQLVERAVRILSGDTQELEEDLEERMQAASKAREFERAGRWRDRLQALRRTVEGQGVRPRDRVARDVLNFARRGDDAVVHCLAFREGRLSESRSHRFRSQLFDEELLHTVVTALYSGGRRQVPEEIVLPALPTADDLLSKTLGGGVKFVVPAGGDRRRMLDIAGENARVRLDSLVAEEETGELLMEELARLLDLEAVPEVIDCFDISNLQDSHLVASRVRFRRGIADRSGYRRFKLREVEGQDDFASMREVVRRSLHRGGSGGQEEGDLPDLVVIDGGKGQLGSALEARDEAGAFSVAFVGLAKARAERRVKGRRTQASCERLFLPGAESAIELPRHSALLHLFERIRNEAHRFAITYHRKERGRIVSRLDSIPGVGPALRKALLRRFGSVRGVQEASVEELAAVPRISAERARAILEHLRGS
ncbi:MAG TPA: excinuclease ABC subunit UvrC [Planctomycetes bacterium]|nr:excinuclease ABC subunit UvrC [Planctomycetota bacterium]HIL52117.1 excinuclease ABC subunit UvrC [Planctomycetota bacterium]